MSSDAPAGGGRRIVLGLGNILNRDEGLGVHTVRRMSDGPSLPKDVELVDGGVLGLSLLPIVESSSHLLVLDAVDSGRAPGTVIHLEREKIPLFSGIHLSQHQVAFQDVLGLAKIRGHLPENLFLIGIQPQDMSIGLELSPVVQRALPELLQAAVTILQQWGFLPPGETWTF